MTLAGENPKCPWCGGPVEWLSSDRVIHGGDEWHKTCLNEAYSEWMSNQYKGNKTDGGL